MAPHSIENLVNEQMLRWNTAERARAEAPRPAPSPSIAVSRQPHSGGSEIAKRLAAQLDYGLFGREIVEEIGREGGVQSKLVEGLDERVRGLIDRYVLDSMRRKTFTEMDYMTSLMRTLRTLAQRGMVVLLGRGAAQVLPSERTLRILVVAPKEFRVERLASTRNLTKAEAEARLAEEDQQRHDFLRHHFAVDQEDPLHYDISVNTGTLSFESAVALALEALGDRFPGARPAASA